MLRVLAALCILFVPAVSAHVPTFDEAGSSAATAFTIEEPTKSWVFFDSLGARGQHWFMFDMDAGQELFASVSLPPEETARPRLWVLVPGSDGPGPVGTPFGWSGERGAGSDVLMFEPFTPIAMRSVAEWRGTAPVNGTYYVVVEGGGTYSLAIGSRESFTASEWLTIPVERIPIQRWGGVPWPVAILGESVGLAAAIYYGRKRSLNAPTILGLAGAGLIAGTFLTTSILASIAAFQAGWSMATIVPAIFALLALGIGYGAYRAVMRPAPVWIQLLWASGALILWAGLLIGPAVLAGSAFWRAGSGGETRDPQRSSTRAISKGRR